MYEAVTRKIRVVVKPDFLPDQSDPDEERFLWAYTITIENHGQSVVQLLSRYWRITDAKGRVQEVRGPGVVGEQPILAPGESFEYTSGCPLTTPSGTMAGRYQMRSTVGEMFEVDIPLFALDSPHTPRSVH